LREVRETQKNKRSPTTRSKNRNRFREKKKTSNLRGKDPLERKSEIDPKRQYMQARKKEKKKAGGSKNKGYGS